jgi:peptidoglycan hydrolase-like protein with peptidoglycan-binding domain
MITILMAILTVAMALSGCSFGPAPSQATHTAPPPPAAVAPAPMPSGIAQSSHSVGDLADVQQRLREAGDYHGPIDGKMGTETAAALRRYQSEHDLLMTGLADEPTREKLGL